MNLWQRFVLWLNGYVYVGDRKRNGWKSPIPFYAFRCPIHGIVEDYAHGTNQRLECPRCKEAKKSG